MDPQPDYFVVWLHNHNLSPESWKTLQVIVVVAAKKALDIFFASVWWMRERHIYIYREREREGARMRGLFLCRCSVDSVFSEITATKAEICCDLWPAAFWQLLYETVMDRRQNSRLSKHSCYIYTLAVRRSDLTKAVSYIKTSDWPELGAKPTVRLLKKLQIIFLILTLELM